MKKSVAGLAVLLPLSLLLCACGSTELSLGANWYLSGNGINVGGKSEQLEYEVSFIADESNQTLSYGKGVYTAKLSVEPVVLSTGESVQGYHLHAELSLPVTYTVGEATETFTDGMVSDVYFKTLSSRLQPVKSVKTVHSASPLTARPKTMDEAYEIYEYEYAVNYTDDFKKAKVSYEQTLPEAKTQEKTISVKNKNIFFDNEQLLFVLRGVDMNSAVSLKTINPLTLKEQGVKTSSPKALAYIDGLDFTLNGTRVTPTEEKPLNAFGVTLSYDGARSGQPQRLIYAAKRENENTYRNVLLEMSVPVLHGLGVLDYKLVSAEFND